MGNPLKLTRKVLTAFVSILLMTTPFNGSNDLLYQDGEDIPLQEYTLLALQNTEIPTYDAFEAAQRYRGVSSEQYSEPSERVSYSVGDVRPFNVLNVTSDEYAQVKAELAYATDHLYFWIQEGIDYDPDAVKLLSDTFEYQIYPTNHLYFGEEASPGLDNDEHLYILYTLGMGGAAGYFSAADTYPTAVEEFSNEAEMFMLSAAYTLLDQEYTYGVLAHEFQHMIHWNLDKNETTWLNEGFAELASLLNGYDVGGTDQVFAGNPDIQLNFWPRREIASTHPHYGAAYLFSTYLYDRFGAEVIRAIINHPANGFDSIDQVLDEVLGEESGLQADDVFQDWTIANILQDSSILDGQYGYSEYLEIPTFRKPVALDCKDEETLEYTVNQYGTDYIEITCETPYVLSVQGEESVPVLPVDPKSGEYYYWSNKGDQSAMKLTQTFDLRDVEGPIILEYSLWYDLESDWDYVYLLASEDGENWQTVITPGCTTENPTGSNQGCGYSGSSEGWVEEKIDLSSFAGKQVTLQFEYLTDLSLHGEGLVIDEMKIDAIGYYSGFEENDGGWLAEGFARIANTLPQAYRAALILKGADGTIVGPVSLNDEQAFSIAIDPELQGSATLVISGVSRFTNMPAGYTVSITPQ